MVTHIVLKDRGSVPVNKFFIEKFGWPNCAMAI